MTTLLSSTCCGAMILETDAKPGELLTEASVVRTFNGVEAKHGQVLICPVCGKALGPAVVMKTDVTSGTVVTELMPQGPKLDGPFGSWCSCGAGEFQPPEKHVAPCPGAVGA